MPIDAIIRVSFQSNIQANRDANQALVGLPQGDGERFSTFRKVNTAVYRCNSAKSEYVMAHLMGLMHTIENHVDTLDFLSVTMTSTEELPSADQ